MNNNSPYKVRLKKPMDTIKCILLIESGVGVCILIEDRETSNIMELRIVGLLLSMFIILFVLTPFAIEIRDGYTHIHSLFFRIQLTITGMLIETPLLSGGDIILSRFLWHNLLQICFALSLLLHYRGMTTRRNALIAGGFGLATGVLTFIMNGIGTLIGSSLIILIPVPIPTLLGFAILVCRPQTEMKLWPTKPDNT